MLGITVPDAIAVGTLVAAALAGWFGRKSGDALSKVKPIDPVTSGIAAGFVDKDKMDRLVVATERIATAMERRIEMETDEHENQITETLLDIQRTQNELARELAGTKRKEDDARAELTAGRAERVIDQTVRRVESTLKKPRRD